MQRKQTSLPLTQNFVKVFKTPNVDETEFDGSGPILMEVGSTESLREESEVFNGVCFADAVACLVTFFWIDPLCVVSFKNPTSPQVLGKPKITGFFSCLHFVNNDETLLLGIGQQAPDDHEGQVPGLQVTLCDAMVLEKPAVINEFPFKLDKDVYSSSTTKFEFKAFRCVRLKEGAGILIILFIVTDCSSMELDEEGDKEDLNYNGFILLDVHCKGVTKRFRIPHEHPFCHCRGCHQSAQQLAECSVVVDGDVMTLKGQSIQKWDLDDKKLLSCISLASQPDQQEELLKGPWM